VIVAAETNFVLELAFRQSEARECERLIELAASGDVELVIPACSLFEPYETLVRRNKQRGALLDAFSREVRELARSEFYSDLTQKAKVIVQPMGESSAVYTDSLAAALTSILPVATIIPLSAHVVDHALALLDTWPISPQDAMVLSSVDLFMRDQGAGKPRLLVSKNRKDFMRSEVIAHFDQCDCRILGNFTAARCLAEATLSS
jgi:predicted nucleic acid-binding protein